MHENELSPYEIFQMQRYGWLLPNHNPEDEFNEQEHRLSTQEENYFFNLENEPQ